MRTTVTIDDKVLAEVKVLAAGRGVTVSSVIEEALQGMLARHRTRVRVDVDLPVHGEPSGRPLIDILDKDALALVLDEDSLP